MKRVNLKRQLLRVAILIVLFIIYQFWIVPSSSRIDIQLVECIDGDTTIFNIDGEDQKVRLLIVDSPERNQPYYSKASNFVCNLYKNAASIELEMDPKAEKDNYDRLLAWIWVDDTLIQQSLLENGYAKIAYVYDDYKYTDDLRIIEESAKQDKLGLWSYP